MKFWPSGPRMWALIVFTILVIFATPLFAQSTLMRLHGQVADPSGAVIPGATISVKNSSGATVTAKSDGAGGYEVRNLAPGKYTISVTAKGFAPMVQDVELAVGQEKRSEEHTSELQSQSKL